MRLFIALPIPDEVRTSIVTEAQSLRASYPRMEWVQPEDYHLTVLYLGERDPSKVPLMDEAINRSIFDISPFHLYFREVRMFQREGIVVYLKCDIPRALHEMRDRLQYYFPARSDEAERPFVAHITIARAKLPSKQQYLHLKKRLEKMRPDLEFPVTQVGLFSSAATKKTTSPLYEMLRTYELVV